MGSDDRAEQLKKERKEERENPTPKEYPKYLYGKNNTFRIVNDPDEEASASEQGFVDKAEDVEEDEEKKDPRGPFPEVPKTPQPHQEPQQLSGPPTPKQQERLQQEQRPRNK